LNRHSKNRSFFESLGAKALVVFLVLLTGFSGYHFFKIKHKQTKVNKEVAELQKQIDEFKKKNKSLEQLSQYLQTDDFKEIEAKKKLNLVKEGEKVVIVKKNEVEKIKEDVENLTPEVEIEKPNYYYWWHYFFGIEVSAVTSANDFK